MRAVRSCIVLLGVFFSALALLAPFLTVPAPWGAEVWFFPSVRELGLGLKLAPTLNGMPFTGPGPLAAVLLSLLPFSDLMALRLLNMLLGCLVCMSVFVFCSSLWDIKSGVCSALFTMTTWGFAATFGHLGPSALPACLAVISFLLFAQIYLMELNPWWYLLAYLLAGGAALTGGWVPLTFFALSAVFLVLIDMAPAKFASIKAFWGIVLVGGAMLAVYGTCRIFEGPALAGSLFSFHQEQGLLARLWLWVKFNLPWLLLAAPAWLYGEGPNEAGAWRSLLAPKTAYASGFAVVLLSGSVQEGYALLGIPFGGILTGYWMSRKFLIREKLKGLRTLAFFGTAFLVAGTALILIVKSSLTRFSLDLAHGAVILAFLAVVLLLFLSARRRSAMAIAGLGMAAVFAMSWHTALVTVPASAEKPASFARQLREVTPLLVFEDDLVMRGYAAWAGAKAVVVGRNMVPVGYTAYLAVTTPDLEALLKNLSARMHASVASSFTTRGTTALIRVAPAVPPSRGPGG